MSTSKRFYKDMDKYRKTRNAQRKKNYSKTAKYPARRWTDDEDDLILAHDMLDVQLSALLHRSVQSIQCRRTRLKNMKNNRGTN